MAYPVVSLKLSCIVTMITKARVDNMPVKDFVSLRGNFGHGLAAALRPIQYSIEF